jgi:hypothetical protein
VAVYSLESPSVRSASTSGRPRLQISEDTLIQLRSLGFTLETISKMLLLSRWTIWRRVKEFGIEEETGYCDLSDEQLDVIVQQFPSTALFWAVLL